MAEDSQELVLEEVVEIEVDDLSEDQTTFLEDNKADLSDEHLEKFGIEKEVDDKPIDPNDIEINTRGGKKEVEVKKEEVVVPEPEVDENGKKIENPVVEAPKDDGLRAEVQELKDRGEVDGFINAKPEFGKYRGVMLKYMAHDAYKNIPVDVIAKIVAGDDMQSLGAAKERIAAAKANDTRKPGGGKRSNKSGETDWGAASKDDFEAKMAEVKHGR